MLLFDQLRISDDGKRMYINIHVNEADYFDNVYLDSITIANAVNVLEAYESDHTDPTVTCAKYIYHLEFDPNLKDAALVLDKGSFDAAYSGLGPGDANESFDGNLSGTLFFVYVKCKLADGSSIDPCTPCTLDEEVTLGVTFDTNMMYQRVMQYTRELSDTCEIPKSFIDYILLWNGFKAAIETEHYIPAINFWKELFWSSNTIAKQGTKPCGCGGR